MIQEYRKMPLYLKFTGFYFILFYLFYLFFIWKQKMREWQMKILLFLFFSRSLSEVTK